MSETQQVTIEDVRHVAELAHLELNAQEEAGMVRDLNAILGHIAQLNELDTSALQPMAQVGEVLRGASGEPRNVLRADIELACLPRAEVMRSAPETDGVFFKVPKVIER